MREWLKEIKDKAKNIKKELRVIYIAYKRPDVPWYAKVVAIIVVGYALSPIDLIPDFVPVLGYLDDIILIPLGILLVVKLIPKDIVEECRKQADEVFKDGKPKNWFAGALIICIWVLLVAFCLYNLYGVFF